MCLRRYRYRLHAVPSIAGHLTESDTPNSAPGRS